MQTLRHIDSCIGVIKQMLGDPNNEMTSEQRNNLVQSVQELKRLRKAKRVSHQQAFEVVGRIAQTVYEVMNTGVEA